LVTHLLDTAPFLWAASAPHLLSVKARKIIEGGKVPLAISAVSLWEVVIKAARGLLPIPNPGEWLDAAVRGLDIEVLPVRAAHVYAIAQLPDIHKDPFDRMLIAQALAEGWTLITSDETVKQYSVTTIW
jgi:PIN domain nuclease of toxin-antitoxin system